MDTMLYNDPDRLIGWREAAALLGCVARGTVYRQLAGLPMPRRGRWRRGDVILRVRMGRSAA